ncbi:MAK10-like protein [Tanacetum coccineum]
MDDPDITMEEYIRLENEEALRNGKVYNKTDTYGKIRSIRLLPIKREFIISILAILYFIFSLCYLFRKSFSSTTIGDENPIRTLGDYSRPSHEGYRNTIELPEGNNAVPRRSTPSASNWLERLPAGSISTWEDLTTRFLAQFFPPGRTVKLSGGKLLDRNAKDSWVLLEGLAFYDNESWNDPRDFAKPVRAISLPQDVPSTSDCRLVELENLVQRLMEAHLAPKQPV